MPKSSPPTPGAVAAGLLALGAQLRAKRKALGVSATVAAEAAGVSRVTLHRIEKGEASVTAGAWGNVAQALGLSLAVQEPAQVGGVPTDRRAWLPVRIVLADYPQLKALAWQVQGVDALTPTEAFDIYERNARHLDVAAMSVQEQDLWQALQQAFVPGGPRV